MLLFLIFFMRVTLHVYDNVKKRRGKRKIPHLAFLSRINKQRYYVFAEEREGWVKKCVYAFLLLTVCIESEKI